jgi:hypothetical protein
MLSLNGNALNWASVRLDASLQGHDTSPTTHTSSFQKKMFIHLFLSYPLVPLPIALIRSPAASKHMVAGPPRRNARPLALPDTACSRLRVVALSCRPCQVQRTIAHSKLRDVTPLVLLRLKICHVIILHRKASMIRSTTICIN